MVSITPKKQNVKPEIILRYSIFEKHLIIFNVLRIGLL